MLEARSGAHTGQYEAEGNGVTVKMNELGPTDTTNRASLGRCSTGGHTAEGPR